MATDVAGGLDEDLETEFDDQPDVDIEARARVMGWKPLAEYRGDPRRWTDAAAFIAHGEEQLPILRDQSRRMSEKLVVQDAKLADLQNTVAEQAQAVRDAMALARKAGEAGYNRALAELKGKQREAVEAGDLVAFEQVEEQIGALETTRAEVVAPAPPPPPPRREEPALPVLPTEINQFYADNPWFKTNPILSKAMIDLHNAVIAESPTMPLADQLEVARGRLKKTFPAAFEEDDDVVEERPRPRARVLAPGAVPPRRPAGASPIDAIQDPTERAEARRAFNSMHKQDEKLTEAEYMSMVDDPHADVLSIIKNRKA